MLAALALKAVLLHFGGKLRKLGTAVLFGRESKIRQLSGGRRIETL